MPITFHDKIMGGLTDIKLTHVDLTKHAKKRCRQRGISLEDIQKKNPEPTLITKGRTILTAYFEETKEYPVSVVHDNPRIIKNSKNKYYSYVTISKEIIPHFVGKGGRNLKSMNLCKIYLENENVKIISDNLEDAIFFNNFISELIKHIENNKSHYFIYGIIKNVPSQIINLSNKISIFHRNGCLYYCGRSSSEIQKILKELDIDERFHKSYASK